MFYEDIKKRYNFSIISLLWHINIDKLILILRIISNWKKIDHIKSTANQLVIFLTFIICALRFSHILLYSQRFLFLLIPCIIICLYLLHVNKTCFCINAFRNLSEGRSARFQLQWNCTSWVSRIPFSHGHSDFENEVLCAR